MLFHRTTPLFFAIVVAFFAITACAPAPVQEVAAQRVTKAVASTLARPTKFARLVPTDTPTPTDTPLPTLTPSPSATPTRTPTRRPTRPAPATALPAAKQAGILGLPPATRPPVAPVAACGQATGASYGTLSPKSGPASPPAASNADLNLALRGYVPTGASPGLVDVGGDTAPNAPQLDGLFTDHRLPTGRGAFQVYDWNWSANARGGPIGDPSVTFVTVAVTPGEVIHVPDAGTNIGLGYAALVLYADTTRITLKYTGEDNVTQGYTLHLENLCIDPSLLALYRQLNGAGRGQLPALYSGQALGRASSADLGMAIRDTGAFLDPRSRKDWWRGY